MPTVQYEVDKIAVEVELMRRNYAIHGQNAHGIQLTVADPTQKPFKFNGAPKRKFLAPVSKEVYRTVRRMSANEKEAADRIEALSHGQEVDLGTAVNQAPAPTLDLATLERIAENRVDAIVAQRTVEIERREAALAEREAAVADQPVEPEEAGKKRKGKKGGVKYERTPAQIAHAEKMRKYWNDRHAAKAAKAVNEPVLTPEQIELAKKAGVPLT